MASTIAHVRFNEHEIEFLKGVVKEGTYNSMSDAIKTAVRLMEFRNLQMRIATKYKDMFNYDKVMKSLKKSRKTVYRKYFGSKKND